MYQNDVSNFDMFMDKIVEEGLNPNNYYNKLIRNEI